MCYIFSKCLGSFIRNITKYVVMNNKLCGMVVTLGLVLTVGVLATTYSQQAFGQHNGVSQNGGNGGSGSNGAIGANGGNGSPNIPCVGGHRTLTANGHTLVQAC